jgi:hypothetical protein
MTKLTQAEFETLPDSLKPKFKADGDAYLLIEEDVDGLKKSKAEILEEKKRIQAERDELAQFKAEQEAKEAAAKLADQEANGEYKKALAEREKAWNERLEGIEAEKNTLFADVKRERLTNELVKRGALADRASYLVGELDANTELTKGDDGKYVLRKKGGIGDAAEFDSVIEAARQNTPFFFAATTASGSGASGSGSNGGSTAKTMPATQFHAMSVQEQAAFIKSGGKPVE